MDMRSIFISNGIGLVLLLVLAFVSRTRLQMKRTEDRLYFLMLFGVMIACVMEVLSYVLDGKVFPGSRVLNYIANTYLFTANMLLPLSVLIYIDLGLYGDRSRILKKYRIQFIVGAVMIAVNVINFFVPISYYITPENVYERRAFSYVYYLVIIYYAVSALVLTHRYEKKYGTRSFFSIEMFLVPIFAGTTLQFIFYGLSLAWLSSAIGLTGLHMMQQNENVYTDPLTELYNRHYLNHIISYWKSKGYRFSGIMIDLDSFKKINDTYGHSEGDAALCSTARIIKSACSDGALAFRFAGDEFIILMRNGDPSSLEMKEASLMKALEEYNRTSGKPYSIGFSYGSGSFDPETGDSDRFIKDLDDAMYEMKKAHHGE